MRRKINSIALLGTSADPPTCGHQMLLEGLIGLFPKVITWASDNPVKRHQIPLEKRYQLLNKLVQEIANPKLEIIQELSSPWTITTLEKARQLWPMDKLTFVIGSDLTKEIVNWLNTRDILKKASIGIVPREGWPIEKKRIKELEDLGGKVYLLPLKIPASSSSNFRKSQEISEIPHALLSLMIEEKLYGLSKHLP